MMTIHTKNLTEETRLEAIELQRVSKRFGFLFKGDTSTQKLDESKLTSTEAIEIWEREKRESTAR